MTAAPGCVRLRAVRAPNRRNDVYTGGKNSSPAAPMTFPARTLLACWLTVAATGATVAHRHACATGDAAGLGWASLGSPSSGPGCNCPHGHFLFLGIEFGETSGDGASSGPDSSRVERVVDGATSPDDNGSAVPTLDALPTVSTWAGAPLIQLPALPPDTAPVPACARTSRTRSGVLRS